MSKQSSYRSDQLSGYLQVDRNGAVQVRLGDFLRSNEGKSQLDALRRVSEIAKGKDRSAGPKEAAGS